MFHHLTGHGHHRHSQHISLQSLTHASERRHLPVAAAVGRSPSQTCLHCCSGWLRPSSEERGGAAAAATAVWACLAG
jgi:hypothetical protein